MQDLKELNEVITAIKEENPPGCGCSDDFQECL